MLSHPPPPPQASVSGEATIAEGAEDGSEETDYAMSPEELEKRMASLLQTCTYTVRMHILGWALVAWRTPLGLVMWMLSLDTHRKKILALAAVLAPPGVQLHPPRPV